MVLLGVRICVPLPWLAKSPFFSRAFFAAVLKMLLLLLGATATTSTITAAATCETDADCSMNGVCDIAAGSCACIAPWTGTHCQKLLRSPASKGAGYRSPYPVDGHTSSWGGSVVRDEQTGLYHMYGEIYQTNCNPAGEIYQTPLCHSKRPRWLKAAGE